MICIAILAIKARTFNLNGENIHCEVTKESLSHRAQFNLTDLEINEKKIFSAVECILTYNSGITYDYIGKNLSEVFKFERRILDEIQAPRNELLELSLTGGELQILPEGFDLVFPNLNILNVSNCELLIIDKQNMKQFGKHLLSADFSYNLLMFFTQDLFDFNSLLQHGDFSGNPLLYIGNIEQFLQPKLMSNAIKARFKYKNVGCADEINFGSKREEIYVWKFDSVNCTSSQVVIDYGDLKYHLTKTPEQTRIVCDFNQNCPENSSHLTLSCDMTVLKRRTIVTSENQFITHSLKKCFENHDEIILNFTEKHIEYIPTNLVKVVQKKIRLLIVASSNLTSVNQFDMRQFGFDLIESDFSFNNLKVIGNNAFRYNKNLQKVTLVGNPIVYVDSIFAITVTYVIQIYISKPEKTPFLCGSK